MSKYDIFSNKFSYDTFKQKYSMDGQETWKDLCKRVVSNVCGQYLDSDTQEKIFNLMLERKFIPGGRYLYSAGRPYHNVNNCFLFKAEDSREGWSDIMQKSTAALLTGGGIGIDYSKVREEGALISRTGGKSTGPLALMNMVNEAGRHIMQGGQRRCLPKGTLVTLSDGTKIAIENVSIGSYVTTRFGSKKVLASVEQGEQEIFKIVTENGETLSTKNHRWLGADLSRNKKWITTENLKVGGKLYHHTTSSELSYNNEDLKYCYTLGYYIGDGCAYSSNRTHEITFQFSDDWKNENQVTMISNIMRSLGTNPTLRKGHGACTELRCRSKKLVKEFQKIKAPNSEPTLNEIFKLSNRAIAIVLAGWLDADGYLNDDKWCISNKYEKTANEVQKLFLKLGVKTTISRTNSCFEVRINSHQRAAIFNYMSEFSVKVKSTNFHQRTSEIPSKILEIKSIGKMQTYDLQIEEVEEFIADNFVSHNSAIWAGLNWKHKDIFKFIDLKNWSTDLLELKKKDLTFPMPMELTNISAIFDTEFFIAYENKDHPLHVHAVSVWTKVCHQAFSTAEPGFSFNFLKDNESARNACQPDFAPVTLSTGTQVTFKDIEVGSELLTGYNSNPTCKVTRKWRNGVKFVWLFTLADNSIFIGTSDHKVVVETPHNTNLKMEIEEARLHGLKIKTRNGYFSISGVYSLGYHDVYEISVDNPQHTYISGNVVTSNCTEVTSEDDSDKCNLGTLWLNRFKNRKEFRSAVDLATQFLLCGGLYSDLPTDKIREIGNKNNRIGLGLGGIHEWLMLNDSKYTVTPELHKYLNVYEQESDSSAYINAKKLGLAIPKGKRAIAPTGTIGIIAETTTGIEPLFCKAYKRRYFKDGKWLYQYVIDGAVKRLLEIGVKIENIQDAYDISFKDRVKFQADVQNYVDMAISSTCNLPQWGTEKNNEKTLAEYSDILMKYAKRLRGFTCYPDGARQGQPLEQVSLEEALKNEGTIYEENEVECKGGICGL